MKKNRGDFMIFHYNLNLSGLQKFPLKIKQDGLLLLEKEATKILREKIKRVYEINERFHPERNYVPLEEMLEAVSVSHQNSPLSISVFVDENKISWKDYQGKEIHEIPGPGEDYEEIKQRKVKTFDKHWKTPIENTREDIWFLYEAWSEIKKYVETDFVKKIVAMSKGGK